MASQTWQSCVSKPYIIGRLTISFVRDACEDLATQMARELDIKGRRYWVLSEPEGSGWKASVVEVRADGSSEHLGIDASGETRSAADDAAERKLRRLLQAY